MAMFPDFTGASLTDPWIAIILAMLLKATVILILAAVAALLLRRASAAARHLVWSLALGGVLALPILSVVLPGWRVPIIAVGSEAGPAPESVLDESPAATGTATTELSAPGSADLPRIPSPTRGEGELGTGHSALDSGHDLAGPSTALSYSRTFALPWMVWILAIAAAGTVLVLGWLLAGQWGVRRLTRRASPVAEPGWTGLLRDLVWMLDVDQPVRLLRTDRASMPLTWGAVRPTVLLPAEAEVWPEERRRIVLLHELAHVKRFDCLTQLIAQLACALFWFHPLAWYAAHRMRIERERACDDLVLGAGTRASSYAGHLLEVARAFRSAGLIAPATVSMARPSQLEGRLLAVLDPARNRQGLTRVAGIFAAIAALVLVVPLAAMQPGARGVAKQPTSAAQDFRWRGRIAPGRTIEIRGIVGSIRAVPASEDLVEVTATKRARDSDPAEVKIDVIEHQGGVTVCAIYPDRPDSRTSNRCQPGSTEQSTNDNDVEVTFTVRVPEGVRFVGSTVDGDVRAESLRSDIDASTISGDILLSTSGYAEATTISGDIQARLGSANWTEALEFKTISGDITVQLPPGANTGVYGEASMAGRIETDFPLTVTKGSFFGGESVAGTIGRGGRDLVLETMSGTIRLHRSDRPAARRSTTTAAPLPPTHETPVREASSSSDEPVWVRSLEGAMTEFGEGVARTVSESMATAFSSVSFGSSRDTLSAETTDALIERLQTDSEPEVRRISAWALAESGSAAVPALARAVQQDESTEVREMASWSLGQIEDPAAIPALRDALRDPDEEVRFTTLWALGEIDGAMTVPALVDVLGDGSARMRERAAWNIGSIEPGTAPPALMAALGDADPDVRKAAAWALGRIEDPAAADALARAVHDRDHDVSRKALWALSRLPEPVAMPVLLDALRSDDEEIRKLAARAIGGGPWPQPWPWPMPRPRPSP